VAVFLEISRNRTDDEGENGEDGEEDKEIRWDVEEEWEEFVAWKERLRQEINELSVPGINGFTVL
jgi:hypothetical protein